jgi:hypothetical protein
MKWRTFIAVVAGGLLASSLTSQAQQTSKGTPSPGTVWINPGDPIPARQWVERLSHIPSDNCNFASSSDSIWNVEKCSGFPPSKHARIFYHRPSKSMVFAGGDRPVSMPHPAYYDGTGSEIVAVNVETNTWKILRPFCVPAEVQPNRPDTSPWAYDSKRDQGVLTPGYFFVSGSGCGALERWGAFAFDFSSRKYLDAAAAGLPAPPTGSGGAGWGGDEGASFGFYVATTDEFCRLRNGPRLECLNRTTKVWRIHNLSVGKPWNPVPHRAQPVLDEQGQFVYWLDIWGEARSATTPGPPMLAKTRLVDGRTVRIPLPPEWRPVEGYGNDMYLAFDTINRLVLIPNQFGMGTSGLFGLGIYHVDTGAWEWDTKVPPAVQGSVWGFDENLGALVGFGKRTQPYGYFIWKYGPKP